MRRRDFNAQRAAQRAESRRLVTETKEEFIMVHSRHILVPFAVGLNLMACTESDSPACPEGGKNADGSIDVGGNLVFHSMNRLATERSGKEVEYSHLVTEIVDLNAMSNSVDAAPLAQISLATDSCGGSSSDPCAYCSSNTNIESNTGDLGAMIRDDRTNDAVWISAVTGIATNEELLELQAAGKALDPRTAFAVTRDAVDSVVAPLAGLNGDELMARGVLFGLIYSTTQSSGDRGEPVAGATVTSSDDNVTIVYPNTNFSSTTSATAGQGVFLAIPKVAGASKTASFTVKPPSGEAHTWDATRLGFFMPNTMYFHVMYTNE
jgi:hypothetical protein